MNFKRISICIGFLLAFSISLSAQTGKKPNVIFILSDDAGYADFGFMGSKLIKTPNLNQLASEGIILTQAYVTASVCCPSRAGILSGRYQQRFGQEFNGPDAKPMPGFTQDDLGLDVNEKTMGDYMKSIGYHTGFAGKWNMGLRPQFLPWKRGFDDFFGFLGGARPYFSVKGEVSEHYVLIKNKKVFPEDSVTYLTDDLTNYAISYIKNNKEKPFFFYLSYNSVHTPLDAKPEDLDYYKNITDKKKRFNAAMTKSMDEGIGKINATLKQLGLDKNTLLIFFNDNGGTPDIAADNGVLRGHKGQNWEGGIRVPCIVKWPAKLKANQKYNEPIMGFDFLPTIYAAGGGKQTLGKTLDGVDLMPYLLKQKSDKPHETLFWRIGDNAAVRHNDWKLVLSPEGDYTLYNIKADISETTDLSAKYPQVKTDLINKLKSWESQLQKPKWTKGGGWIKYDIANYLSQQNDNK
ncbi:sulfatase-like hydrolase/transferase [Pedobacter sp. SD-b]|uniref:Sulfatase-like hydrolase/transferase n=1 Tax=Pedobacter segetis TaxID=2793069 RepID=A0ABS1BME7_9SPHI|nr:sulfatase-like hydrolase/transferase [Pedobacter segetis]MBK0384067.1 sulfatase-like hydrolase/transferase [Pedobacter segetis]